MLTDRGRGRLRAPAAPADRGNAAAQSPCGPPANPISDMSNSMKRKVREGVREEKETNRVNKKRTARTTSGSMR